MSLLWFGLGILSCLPWIIGMEFLRREQNREIEYWYENSNKWMRAYLAPPKRPKRFWQRTTDNEEAHAHG